MIVTRANVEDAKAIFFARLGDAYVYGGTWNPTDVKAGCDCSGEVTDELGAVYFGTAMHWDREGLSTESYRYKPLGVQTIGPFAGLVHVAAPGDIPAGAAVKIALHHEGEGGPDSHMWCEIDGVLMETNGDVGTCTAPVALTIDSSYANDWWYLPGPIVEDGTPVTAPPEPADTLFADVSEFQVPVDDSYPYAVLSIRSNDGTYRDQKFAANYAWMRAALDSGRLRMGFVYFYWRTNWQDAVATHQDMINTYGGVHPRMVSMIDVERGGNPTADYSVALNATDDALSAWLGDPRRVVAYGNTGDLQALWPSRREDQFIVAGYGSNPAWPGKIAHQYTDGGGYGAASGLPDGCPPFGNCDMNSADGYTATALAAACGIDTTPPAVPAAPTPLGGLSMADASTITSLVSGTNEDGTPLLGPDGADYRRVDALADYTGPAGADGLGKYGTAGETPEGPNTSRSLLDVGGTTTAKILTRRYPNKHGQKLDLFDLLVGIYQASGEPQVVQGPVTT